MHARGPDGQTIEDIQISWSDADQSSGFEKVTDSTRGQALLTLRDDYQAVKNSIRALSMADADTTGVLSSQLFRRVTFLAALNNLQAYAGNCYKPRQELHRYWKNCLPEVMKSCVLVWQAAVLPIMRHSGHRPFANRFRQQPYLNQHRTNRVIFLRTGLCFQTAGPVASDSSGFLQRLECDLGTVNQLDLLLQRNQPGVIL